MDASTNTLLSANQPASQSGQFSIDSNLNKNKGLDGGRLFFSMLSASKQSGADSFSSRVTGNMPGNDLPLLGDSLPQLATLLEDDGSLLSSDSGLINSPELVEPSSLFGLPGLVQADFDALKLRNVLLNSASSSTSTISGQQGASSGIQSTINAQQSLAALAAGDAGDLPENDLFLNDELQLNPERVNEKLTTLSSILAKDELLQKDRLLLKTSTAARAVEGVVGGSTDGESDDGIASFIEGSQSINDKSVATSKPQLSLYSPGGKADWSANIATQVKWMLSNNLQSAQMRVDPQHLGPLDIKLTMSDGQINVSIGTPHNLVKEALDSSAAQLRENLKEEGEVAVDVDLQKDMKGDQSSSEEANSFTSAFTSHISDEVEGKNSIHQSPVESSSIIDFYA